MYSFYENKVFNVEVQNHWNLRGIFKNNKNRNIQSSDFIKTLNFCVFLFNAVLKWEALQKWGAHGLKGTLAGFLQMRCKHFIW